MKRFLFLFLLIFILDGMTGCGQDNFRIDKEKNKFVEIGKKDSILPNSREMAAAPENAEDDEKNLLLNINAPDGTVKWGFAMSDICSGKKPLLNITYKKLVQSFGLPAHMRTCKINSPADGPDTFEYYHIAEYPGMELEFYSGYQPKKQPSETDTTFRFDLTGNGQALDCGLKVGMTVKEVTDRFGDRNIYNLEAEEKDTEKKIEDTYELNDIKHILTSHKPADMYNNYQKAMIVYADPHKSDEPVKAQALVLLIKESKVDRIVFGYPTAD